MKKITNRFVVRTIVTVLVLAMGYMTINAQNEEKREEMSDARKDVAKASKVLSEMMNKPDDYIPRSLLQKANAIAIFPGVVKGAFIVGGRGGEGVVVTRTPTGWSVPIFYNIGGASFGPQIGVKETDYIMLFMNDGAVKHLKENNFEFGGAVSFAAGPVGRTAGANTNATLDAGILTYSHSKGAFVGASLKGADVSADDSKNKAIYGMTAEQILNNPGGVAATGLPTELTSFPNSMRTYTGSR